MAYETTASFRPYAAGAWVYICPLDDCDWNELNPGELALRNHLEKHDVSEWARTVARWHNRAVKAEREVAELHQRPGEPCGCSGAPVWTSTPRGPMPCCTEHRDEHDRWAATLTT